MDFWEKQTFEKYNFKESRKKKKILLGKKSNSHLKEFSEQQNG